MKNTKVLNLSPATFIAFFNIYAHQVYSNKKEKVNNLSWRKEIIEKLIDSSLSKVPPIVLVVADAPKLTHSINPVAMREAAFIIIVDVFCGRIPLLEQTYILLARLLADCAIIFTDD